MLIPVYVYTTEALTDGPNLEQVKMLGYVGAGICMISLAATVGQVAMATLGASGFIGVPLLGSMRESNNTREQNNKIIKKTSRV